MSDGAFHQPYEVRGCVCSLPKICKALGSSSFKCQWEGGNNLRTLFMGRRDNAYCKGFSNVIPFLFARRCSTFIPLLFSFRSPACFVLTRSTKITLIKVLSRARKLFIDYFCENLISIRYSCRVLLFCFLPADMLSS